MKIYIATKMVNATPMSREDYNRFRGWELPSDEDGADEGYLVEYMDGGKPNVPSHRGYVTWNPKEQFERAYRETSGLTFGAAVETLKRGGRVARTGWNGKGMWLETVNEQSASAAVFLRGLSARPWIGMKTVDDAFVPWVASQTDILAEDWVLVA